MLLPWSVPVRFCWKWEDSSDEVSYDLLASVIIIIIVVVVVVVVVMWHVQLKPEVGWLSCAFDSVNTLQYSTVSCVNS